MENQTRINGVIQNSEYLEKALEEDREFLIVCDNEKDADSKRVSLFQARRKMDPLNQKKLRIRKEAVEGMWVVRIWKDRTKVLEIVDGKLVEVQDEAS